MPAGDPRPVTHPPLPPLATSAIRGFLWILSSSLLGAVVRLTLFALLARLVSPADFGVITAALILVGLADLLIGVGAGPALVQKLELRADELSTAFWSTLVITVLGAAGMIWVREWLAALIGVPEVDVVVPVLALVFLFKGLQALPVSLLRRAMRFRDLALIDAVCFVLSYGGAGLSLALMGYGYWSLVYATVVQAVLQCALAWLLARPNVEGPFTLEAFRSLYVFGAGATFTRVAHELLSGVDKWLAGRMLGAEGLGVYGRAYALANFPHGFVANAIDKVVFSAFSKRQADVQGLRNACLRAYSLVAFALLPAAALVAILAPEIVRILLGPGWEKVVGPLQLLAFAACFRSNLRLSSALAQAVGRVFSLSAIVAVQGVVTFLLCLFGSQWGLEGLAAGYLAACIVQLFISMWLNARIVGAIAARDWLRIGRDAVIQMTLVLLLAGGFATWLRHLAAPAVLVVLLSGLLCVGVYLAVLLIPRLPWGADLRWAVELLSGSGRNPAEAGTGMDSQADSK